MSPTPARKAPHGAHLTRRTWRAGSQGIVALFGGTARTRVILLLGGVLALNSADTATVGASATQLRHGLQISNGGIGLLVAVTAVVVAIFSVPYGVLVDRANRIAILTTTVAAWGIIMLASAAVSNFRQLLLARLALGAVTAASGPGVASLIGDYFPAEERGKIYGYVLAGELLGAGAGFVISGDAADISWRAAFLILALPTVPLAWSLRRLPEPARGGLSQLRPGATRLIGRRDVRDRRNSDPAWGSRGEAPPEDRQSDAQEVAFRRGVEPDPHLILHGDPRKMGVLRMMRYVLSIRTNRILILSSACGYFFLTGVETFGLEFVTERPGQYEVAQFLASLLMLVVGAGAVFGVLLGGRVGDALVHRGHLRGRLVVAAVAAFLTTILFIPALITHSIFTALPYLVAAGFFLTAQNPPIDAARLDVMPPLLWGRAEGVRSFLRTAAQALAPVAFGGLSGIIGLRYTFAVMLVPFLASAVILVIGMRTYPRDVATAAASGKVR